MIAVSVLEQSGVAEARRHARDMARRHGFAENDIGRVELVATELASNLVKHSPGGELLVGTFDHGDGVTGIELVALDQGPGIANVEACVADGYSSAGTSGHGMGAVIRQSHYVDIASWTGVGTGVLARLAPGAPPAARAPPSQWGAVSIPKKGQQVCGDAWSVSDTPAGRLLLVADGLGHGPEAAEAAVEAVRLFHRFNGHQVPTLLDYIHGGLRATRGAAVSIARFEPGKLNYAGIGNIGGVIISGGSMRRMVSMAGTAGHIARKIQAFDYPFQGGIVVLYSDGIASNWTVDRYPGLAAFHPTLIAAVLYRDLTRHRDDATVLVAKW